MGKAWFEYKGVNSLDMHLRILNDISFSSPEADVELIEVLGRDGDLAIDNQRLKGTSFSIPVILQLPSHLTVNDVATKISEWLKNDIGWYPLRFSGSSEYEYIALCYEQFDIAETLKQYGRTVITFRLKPYKRKKDVYRTEIKNGGVLVNQEKRASKPLIYVEGTGDIDFQKNGTDWLKLTSIDEFIHVDSEAMSVYRNVGEPQFNKMNSTLTPMFPILESGENKITWSGNVTKIEIDPRWEAVT